VRQVCIQAQMRGQWAKMSFIDGQQRTEAQWNLLCVTCPRTIKAHAPDSSPLPIAV